MALIDILAGGVVNSSGAVLSSGLVYIYQVGTTTKVTTYQDEDLTIPHSNPLTLDAAGKAEVYVDQAVRLVIQTSAGVSVDDIAEVGANLSQDDLSDDIEAVEELALSALEQEGLTKNLALSLNAGVLSIVGDDGNAISSANLGYVTVPSTTAGRKVTLRVTAGGSINDDSHASSDFTNLGFGITEAADWAQDMPFFLYVVNRANTDVDGADGSSAFFLSRSPSLSTTPSAADDIGDTGGIPTNDTQNVIIILDDVTVANYVSLPCQLIGAVRMRWSTSTDDWTVQTLGNKDGFGSEQLKKTFSTVWTMALGQNGAEAGKYFTSTDGVTALTFSPTNSCKYTISQNGECTVYYDFDNQSANGADGTAVRWTLPYTNSQSTDGASGACRITLGGSVVLANVFPIASGSYATAVESGGGFVLDNDFSNTADLFKGSLTYLAFA